MDWFYYFLIIFFAIVFIHGVYLAQKEIGEDKSRRAWKQGLQFGEAVGRNSIGDKIIVVGNQIAYDKTEEIYANFDVKEYRKKELLNAMVKHIKQLIKITEEKGWLDDITILRARLKMFID